MELHETQRFLRRQKGTHGIFLDVVIEDSKRVIVFEAQMSNKGDIGRRTRYYQGVLDTAMLPAWASCQDEQSRALMKYVDTQRAESDLTHKIDERIKGERETQRLRSDYMTYQMRLDERYAEGVAAGFDRGSYERAVDDARSFLQMGLSVQQVAQGTALSIDEVQTLL